jgi:hypothetical protein
MMADASPPKGAASPDKPRDDKKITKLSEEPEV